MTNLVVAGALALDSIETANGRVLDVLGGSAAYFAVAARYFSPVSIVGAIGDDFDPAFCQALAGCGIDLRGLERRLGKSLRWHGRYHQNMNRRDTVSLSLNVFEGFTPTLLPEHRCCEFLFLANIAPDLQAHVVAQAEGPCFVGGDTMSDWIQNSNAELRELLPRLDILTLNDEEARLLSGEHNLVKAGGAIRAMGPGSVLIKRGEYGALLFSGESICPVPAYHLEEVIDPTGAGDAFAGAMMGYLAHAGEATESSLRTAAFYGSVLGSFAVERFSLERLLSLTRPEIDHRYHRLIELAGSNQSAPSVR